MEVIRTPKGKVIWKGTWKVGIMARCKKYVERTESPIEVWRHNGSYMFTIYPKQNETDTPPPPTRRNSAIQAGIRCSEANEV